MPVLVHIPCGIFGGGPDNIEESGVRPAVTVIGVQMQLGGLNVWPSAFWLSVPDSAAKFNHDCTAGL